LLSASSIAGIAALFAAGFFFFFFFTSEAGLLLHDTDGSAEVAITGNAVADCAIVAVTDVGDDADCCELAAAAAADAGVTPAATVVAGAVLTGSTPVDAGFFADFFFFFLLEEDPAALAAAPLEELSTIAMTDPFGLSRTSDWTMLEPETGMHGTTGQHK